MKFKHQLHGINKIFKQFFENLEQNRTPTLINESKKFQNVSLNYFN